MPAKYLSSISMELRLLMQERLISILVVAFLLLSLASGLIGWSTTHTIHSAYAYSVPLMQASATIPPDPLVNTSHLAQLANLSIYIFLIGSLLAIVLGYSVGSRDRTSGMLALVLTRTPSKWAYVLRKASICAIALFVLLGLTFFALLIISALAPGLSFSGTQVIRLVIFLGVSWVYLSLFSFIALISSLQQTTITRALMIPILIWVLIGFMVPQMLTHVEPVALLNPVPLADQAAALSSSALPLLSVGQQFTTLGLAVLEYGTVQVATSQVVSLLLFAAVVGAGFVVSMKRWQFSEGKLQ